MLLKLEGTAFWESPTLEVNTSDENKKAFEDFIKKKISNEKEFSIFKL